MTYIESKSKHTTRALSSHPAGRHSRRRSRSADHRSLRHRSRPAGSPAGRSHLLKKPSVTCRHRPRLRRIATLRTTETSLAKRTLTAVATTVAAALAYKFHKQSASCKPAAPPDELTATAVPTTAVASSTIA